MTITDEMIEAGVTAMAEAAWDLYGEEDFVRKPEDYQVIRRILDAALRVDDNSAVALAIAEEALTHARAEVERLREGGEREYKAKHAAIEARSKAEAEVERLREAATEAREALMGYMQGESGLPFTEAYGSVRKALGYIDAALRVDDSP